MYLTDIVVNFQNYFLDYFDWNKFDKIDTLKKTFIFKVDNLENIIYFNAQFDSKFLDLIKNKTFNSKNNSYSYVCALTDGIKVVIVNLDNKGFIKEISDINIVDDVSITNILLYKKQEKVDYKTLENAKKFVFLTRNEKEIKKCINDNFLNVDEDLLKYLYLCLFNERENSVSKANKRLKKFLLDSWEDNYLKLYDLLKCNLIV